MVTLTETAGLFNGLTWHSQTLWPLVALLNAFLLSDYLFNIQRKSRLYLMLLVCIPLIVYITSSRTAMGGYLISLSATIGFYLKARGVPVIKKHKVVSVFVLFLVLGTVFMVVRPGGVERIEAFLRKSRNVEEMDRSTGLKESLLSSRQALIDQGLENFAKSPMIGNGFQVSESMCNISFSEINQMLTMPIEKGVLWVMILEEGGIFGAIIFLFFILTVYRVFDKKEYYCFLSTFTVLLLLNFGEASFFSSSGGGGVLWAICFIALLMDVERLKYRKAHDLPTYFSERSIRP